jgi:hypothetical protein
MLQVVGRRGQIQSTAHGQAPPRYRPHRLVYCLPNAHSDTLYICGSLGASPKVREATVSFRHVCLSQWKNSTPTGRIFIKFDV